MSKIKEILARFANWFDGLPRGLKAIVYDLIAAIGALAIVDLQSLLDGDINRYAAALVAAGIALIVWFVAQLPVSK